MPSPFSGMNPYLEQADVWGDFHQSFLTELRNRIADRASAEYVVKLEAHIYLHELSAEERGFLGEADVGVSHLRSRQDRSAGATMLEAPITFHIRGVVESRRPLIEIRDRERRRLVTVIEMLSPSNKYSGPDREAYISKRKSLLHGNINFVELDLLRGGPRMPNPESPPCDYSVLVRRVVDWPRAGLWPIQLRDPLPVIPIPLREPDPDIPLDLQQLLHTVYDAAHYGNYIYAGVPDPTLTADNQAWANSLVPSPLR